MSTASELSALADQTNDIQDHDELHAAAAILTLRPELAFGSVYVRRWVKGLCDRHSVKFTVEGAM